MQVEAEHLGKYVSRCGSTFIGETTGYYDIVRATTGVNPVTGEELTAAERTKHAGLAAAGFIPVIGGAAGQSKAEKQPTIHTKGRKRQILL